MPTGIESEFWTPEALARAAGGRWLLPPADARATVAGVTTDTRALGRGQAYFAIRGERFDGHDYVGDALGAGASMAVVEREAGWRRPDGATGGVLLVDGTVAALQRAARAYRDVLRDAGCRVIGITGSNGKTTTRNLVHTVLSARLTGTQSPKSFNNHLGVPLTLLGARPGHGFVVVEIGSNHPGEVAALAEIVRPDAAVVTSIGHEHMEFFGTLENVAREEFSVLGFVAGGGLAVVPSAERLVDFALRTANGEWVRSSPPPRLEARGSGLRVVVFEEDAAVPADLPLPGEHNRRNAAAAAAVGRWLGLDDAAIREALRGARPVEGRLQTLSYGGVTVVNDAYNANPSSMREALRTLASLPAGAGGRRVAVLGDMFELGDEGPALHRQTAEVIAELTRADASAVGLVVTIGPLSMFTAEALTRLWGDGSRVRPIAAWGEGVPAEVAGWLREGDVVLLKGSRGMRLERLLPAIEAAFGRGGGERG